MTNPTSRVGKLITRSLALLLLGATLTCSDLLGIRAGTEVSLEIVPDTVQPGEALVAKLRIRNVSRRDLTLRSSMGCISFLVVHESPWGDPVSGTDFGCTAVYKEFPIRAGSTFEATWDLKASTSTGSLLLPGTYHLEAVLNVQDLAHPITRFQVAGGS